MALTDEDRYRGCLLGLACGDAVGATVEFLQRGAFAPVSDMTGGGRFDLNPGEWTDDTSMALSLAHSLVHCQGFNPVDQMNRYCNWWNVGYMSSTGECFDIGNTARRKAPAPRTGRWKPSNARACLVCSLAPRLAAA